MSLDGIKRVKKEHREKKLAPIKNNNDSDFWDVEIEPSSKKQQKSPQKKFNKPQAKFKIPNIHALETISEIRRYLFNQKTLLVFLASILIISLSTVVFSSYNFINENYDFIKLFKSGRYLIVLQNNSEMRATGGFIGSFAVVETENGMLKNYSFDTNIYKRDKAFEEESGIKPPDPVLEFFLGNNRWAMRDANWYIDFPTSAKQIAWFYEKEGGKPVDGVIAVNATVMNDILRITGPMSVPGYDNSINADNFLEKIELEKKEYYDNPINRIINEPKSILKDLAPVVLEKITHKNSYNQIIELLKKELQEKQILFYFYDDNKQKIAEDNNWSGQVVQHNGDYLYVNASNLGGYKSSLKIKEDININTSIANDGVVINTLNITRTHKGDGVWPDGVNDSYIRILVPFGSQIVTGKLDDVSVIKDIEVKRESGKSVFSLWIKVEPRSTRILTLTYKLPEKILKKDYSIYVQKQPGNMGDSLTTSVNGDIRFNGILNFDQLIK